MSAASPNAPFASVSVRAMGEADLWEVRRIFRVAFGTFIGVPDPENFSADREFVFTRWRSHPEGALVAEADGALVGSNFVARWGSFGFFGPLTVRPDLWNRRIGQALLGATMDLFARWSVRDAGLFTFAHSPRHVALYQKFGFWPRFLTVILAKDVAAGEADFLKLSGMRAAEREQVIDACREITGAIHDGLDVSMEIRSVEEQKLGDTVLLWGDRLEAFAVCHGGAESEAGPNNCYLKFAAVRPGAGAENTFGRLLDACESLAAGRGWGRLEAGVNVARGEAYRHLLGRGFRTSFQGLAMQKPDAPGYNRAGVFVLDDWR